MALFFGGNPFATSVGKKIEQATEASLPSENWSLNMEICDLINETEDGPADAIKAIKKRLSQNSSKTFATTMYTLTVLETCVKNCHCKFLVLVCNKDFIQELVKLIGPKNEPAVAVQRRVLGLIQSWANEFKNQSELSGVCQVYMDLKLKGIEFPLNDSDSTSPIYMPQRSLQEETVSINSLQTAHTNRPSPLSTLTPDQLGKLTSELRVVEGNMAVLSEMLGELTPGNEPPADLELLKELYTTCQSMQERLVDLINQLSNDEITAELLRVNDGLNNLFLRYRRYEKNRKSCTEGKGNHERALIDLNVNDATEVSSVTSQMSNMSMTGATASSQLHLIPSVTAQNHKDEFDIFAQSRNVTCDSKTGNTFGDPKKGGSPSSDLLISSINQPKQHNTMHLEQDFDEMAAWLGEKQEESITSSEFEKFLAERAAAAEGLPLDGNSPQPSDNGLSSEPK